MAKMNKASPDAADAANNSPQGNQGRWKTFTPGDIKALRRRLGLTQLQFALRLDFTYELVRSWEQNKRVPDQRTCLILTLVECNPDAFFQLVAEAEAHQSNKSHR